MHDKRELLEAYDRTAPYCMTLQQFIDFDHYVRCFTFGKTDITPVAYDPRRAPLSRRARIPVAPISARASSATRRLINLALGYEMNTIEFAIKDGVPYAIDYLNPAPDFERDRITPFYFSHVVEKMAHLVVDRALNGHPAQCWPRWEEMLGHRACVRLYRGPRPALTGKSHGPDQRLACAASSRRRADAKVHHRVRRLDAREEADVRPPRALSVSSAVLSHRRRRGAHSRRGRDDCHAR